MTETSIVTSTADIISPTISSKGNYRFDTTALTFYQSKTIATGASLISAQGIADMPIISLSTISKIDTFNLYIRTSANTSDADSWVFRWLPVWLALKDPSAVSVLRYSVFAEQDDGTKVLTRTQPANTNTVDSLMYVSTTSTATLISGGGSETSVAATQKVAITSPYMMIDLTAGANSIITIEEMQIWGARRRA